MQNERHVNRCFFAGAASKFYIVLEVTNLSKKKFILLSSDHYPPQGFTVNPGTVAKIKKAVSRPSAVIFSVRDDEGKNKLYLNGQYNISVSPTKSPLQEIKITVTREGLLNRFVCLFFVCLLNMNI